MTLAAIAAQINEAFNIQTDLASQIAFYAMRAIDNFASAMQVSIDGTTWLTPIGMNDDDPINIVFIFSGDVSAATQWRVQDGSVWHFVDGQELGEPFAGTIE